MVAGYPLSRVAISVRNTFVHFSEGCNEDLPRAHHSSRRSSCRSKTVPACFFAQLFETEALSADLRALAKKGSTDAQEDSDETNELTDDNDFRSLAEVRTLRSSSPSGSTDVQEEASEGSGPTCDHYLQSSAQDNPADLEEGALQIQDRPDCPYWQEYVPSMLTPRMPKPSPTIDTAVDAMEVQTPQPPVLTMTPTLSGHMQIVQLFPDSQMVPLWPQTPPSNHMPCDATPPVAHQKLVEEPVTQMDSPPAKMDGRTTVVLQNLPLNYRRPMLLRMLDVQGFSGKYDFVYVPLDFQTRTGLGYAFVNLVDASAVPHFWHVFDGYRKWIFPSAKICRVTWSTPYQGLKAHVKRYRNCSLMHESVPDEYRPALFEGGARVAFPPPTRRLAAPSQKAAVKRNKGGRKATP